MKRDIARARRIALGLSAYGLDGLVCARPSNVLLLTGYWPVVGTAVALVNRAGQVGLVAPEGERPFAEGHAHAVAWFASGSLDDLRPPLAVAAEPLRRVAAALGLDRGCVGVEHGASVEPASYVAVQRYDADLRDALARETVALLPADDLLAQLRAAFTPTEVERVRGACRVAARAFAAGLPSLRAGARETAVAAAFGAPLGELMADETGDRAEGHVSCMSGPQGAVAHRAYARSTARELRPGDLALVHCNSTVDGYWTDLTRTFCVGRPDERQRAMYAAVFEARDAALAALRPGARAAEVDAAARRILTARGFGPAFKHAVGHGVGFAAIDHLARPRLHPCSDDVLEEGMVMNIEPAVYLDDCGLRHCDMVLCAADGPQVLTPFLTTMDELTVPPDARRHGA